MPKLLTYIAYLLGASCVLVGLISIFTAHPARRSPPQA
jgi:hypothetical protein